MFGFIRKAKEGWERKVEEMRAPVAEELRTILLHVSVRAAVLHGFEEGDDNSKVLMERQGQLVLGFEAFREGCDPRELSDAQPLIKCAAALAQVACNDAILKGSVDQQKIGREFIKLLGFA